MYQGRVFNGIKNGVHGIFHRQDEAGTQAHITSSACEGRAVREEIAVHHDLEKLAGPFLPVRLVLLGGSYEVGHPFEKVGRRFIQKFPPVIFHEVTGFEDAYGILRKTIPGSHCSS
jgi:hypothetical protein